METPIGTTEAPWTSSETTNLSPADHKDDSETDSSEAYSVDSDFPDGIQDDESTDTEQPRTVEQAFVTDPSQLVINVRTTLKNCHRFRKPVVGSTLKIRLLNPKPYQTNLKPLFELDEVAEQYRKMEKEMLELYQSFVSLPVLQPSQIRNGHYAILVDSMNTLNRIRFIGGPARDSVLIELIDYYWVMKVDINSQFLHLDEVFTNLPPRVAAIRMEGMSKYEQHEIFKQLSSHTSPKFLFDGVLTAEVQTSGKVVIWSDSFPKDEHPYGINGYITKVFIEQLQEPKLPPLDGKTHNAFVVHASNSYVSLQIQSLTADHFHAIFNSVSNEDITKIKGAVKLTAANQRHNKKYFAQHEVYEAYFRATILSRIGNDKVRVCFIDYGDEGIANIEDLALCSDIHPLLELFPPQCIKVRLQNVENLDAEAYFEKYHSEDQPYIVHVVKNASENSLAEVVLWLKDKAKSLNEKIVEDKFGTPINPSYKPKDIEVHSDRCLNKLTLYMTLDKGRRLKPDLPLTVNVSYHGSIENMFFISMFSQQQAFRKLEEDIKEDYELPWNRCENIYKGLWIKDSPMLCYSSELKKVARAMLVNKMVEYGTMVGQDGMIRETPTASRWQVYLIDHGIFEIIKVTDFRMMMPNFMFVPVFGIRATFDGFDTPEKILQWVNSWGIREKRFDVVVTSTSQDQFGEIAQVVLKKTDE